MSNDTEYPILALKATLHEKVRTPDGNGGFVTVTVPEPHMYKVGDIKGPSIDGWRGEITKIEKRTHEMGAEFSVYVSNEGVSRLWREMSSHEYEVTRNIKDGLE